MNNLELLIYKLINKEKLQLRLKNGQYYIQILITKCFSYLLISEAFLKFISEFGY